LPGEGRTAHREGDIYYNVAGPEQAESLVLLHDFYAGASNYTFRRIYPRLATDYRVYAPDWLGFGLSERPALPYTGELYAGLLNGFLQDTIQRPAIVVAHGLAANIAVRAASDEPDAFARLVLVAPHALADVMPGPTLGQALTRAAQRSSLGLVPYAAVATRSALRWQLRRRAAHPGEGAATDDALEHAYASAHQFGGQHAALALLTGELDLPMLNAFALLEPPVLVVGAGWDRVMPPELLEELAQLNPYGQLAIIPEAGHGVLEDQPVTFVQRVVEWLRTPQERHPAEAAALLEMEEDELALDEREAAQGELAETPGATVTGGIFSAPEAVEVAGTELPGGAPDVGVSERFGEVRGLVTPVPGLETLGGLMEHAPEAVPLEQIEAEKGEELPGGPDFEPLDVAGSVAGAGGPPEREAAAGATSTIGKPASEIEEGSPAGETGEADQVQRSLDAPEVATPTTLSATTAALDTGAPPEDEGPPAPDHGPHPVPADARETPDAPEAPDAQDQRGPADLPAAHAALQAAVSHEASAAAQGQAAPEEAATEDAAPAEEGTPAGVVTPQESLGSAMAEAAATVEMTEALAEIEQRTGRGATREGQPGQADVMGQDTDEPTKAATDVTGSSASGPAAAPARGAAPPDREVPRPRQALRGGAGSAGAGRDRPRTAPAPGSVAPGRGTGSAQSAQNEKGSARAQPPAAAQGHGPASRKRPARKSKNHRK
jgi:pimeloyl-ACP methyl ester carboxylesterase